MLCSVETLGGALHLAMGVIQAHVVHIVNNVISLLSTSYRVCKLNHLFIELRYVHSHCPWRVMGDSSHC